jgi:hypothetical protein
LNNDNSKWNWKIFQTAYQNDICEEERLLQMKVELISIITCPVCGARQPETMLTNACQYFYECKKCHTRLRPQQGDCCVFCSYATVKCPPMQLKEDCCQ